VARSRRPHRNPCHCRVTNRPRSSPPLVCWDPASHRFHSSLPCGGPSKTFGRSPSSATARWFFPQSVCSTPACSLLILSDRAFRNRCFPRMPLSVDLQSERQSGIYVHLSDSISSHWYRNTPRLRDGRGMRSYLYQALDGRTSAEEVQNKRASKRSVNSTHQFVSDC